MDRLDRATRTYARLLLLYPAPYRARFGAEMRQNFRDLYRDAARSGRPGRRFWARTLADVGANAFKQYGSLIGSNNEMKDFFSNNANPRALLWGFLLMVPAGAFFVAVPVIRLLAPGFVRWLYVDPLGYWILVPLVGFPALAAALNAAPLIAKAATGRERLGVGFVKHNFWTIGLALVALGWLVFLFGHDTIGCAVHTLPLLHWADFQSCAASH